MARIGIVIYSLAGGGAERVTVNLAHGFISRGHDVDFILARRDGELLESVPRRATVYAATRHSATSWRDEIREYAASQQPSVILAMMEGAGILALQAARTTPVFVRSPVHFSRHYPHSDDWKERHLLKWAMRWYFRRADGVVGLSQGVTKETSRIAWLARRKVTTIYNPTLTREFDRSVQLSVNHPWLCPDRTWLTVLNVGRLVSQKDQATLLRSVAKLSEKRAVRLIILGQGPLHNQLVNLARELGIEHIVEFLGFVRNPYAYMRACDVFALSSAWEGLGNVLVEALAAGAAVVSTDCESGPNEILADGQFGELVKVGDHEHLATAIDNAPNAFRDCRALKKHLKLFRSEPVTEQYLRLFGL